MDPTQYSSYLFPFKYAKGVDTSYPHRKLTLFHTLPVDATAAITLAAGGEWLSETLDVLFGKRDVYPSAVVLPNRSVGDAFATFWTFILCSVVFQLPYSLDNQGYRSSVVTFTKGQPLV